MNKNASVRKAGDITIVELKGKITIGAGDLQMREAIHAVLNEGARKLVVDMSGVTTIDSSGVGELVGCYTTSTHKGAKMKLMNLPAKISDVLTVTQLITVFDVYPNEAEASYETLGGMIMTEMERIPGTGDVVDWNSWRFEVVDMDGYRVDKVLASRVQDTAPKTSKQTS